MAGAVDRYLPLIQKSAQKYGLNPALLAALVEFESGGNPGAINKSSGATGLGQVMPREAGFAGRPTQQELLDPETNLDWSARILADGVKRYGSEDQGLAAYLGAIDAKGNITGARDANGTDGPKYIKAVRANLSKYEGAAAQPPGSPAPAGPSWAWPIDIPWGSGITNPFGDKQVRAQGTTIALPEKNVGMDIGAPVGTPIRSPVSGQILRTVRAHGPNIRDDNDGYGEFVVIRGDDGREHLLAHMQQGSGVEAGQRVAAGQPIGRVGVTGNTTGPHVNWEAKNAKGQYEDPNLFNRHGYDARPANVVTVAARDGSGKTYDLSIPDFGEALPWTPLPVWLQQKGLSPENSDMARSWSQPYQASDSVWHFPYTENGSSGEELMSDADYRSWQTQQQQLSSAGSTSSSATTASTPTVSGGNSNLGSPSGPSAAALQAMFNAALTLSQQATNQLSAQGLSPQMVWNPNAYGEGRGAFVPTGETVATLESIAKQYDVNRTQITALASQAQQAGRVPALRLDENGYLRQVLDEGGNPIYEETLGSRAMRLEAGKGVGYLSKDLLAPPPALPANARLGPAVGQNFAGQGNGARPTAAPSPVSNAGGTRVPTAGATTRTSTSTPAPSPAGTAVNPAVAAGQPVYSNPAANQQYPSGTGTNAQGLGGSAYALSTPQDNQTAGGRANDGQSFKDQGQDVIQMFVNAYGPQDAERRWIEEHNRSAGGGDGTPPMGAGGGLNQQIGAGVVQSSDSGDSTQQRIERRMSTGVIPGDLTTVDGTEGNTVASASVFPNAEFGQLPGVTYGEPSDDPNRVRYGDQSYAAGETFPGGGVDASGQRYFLGRADEGGPLGRGPVENVVTDGQVSHVRLGRGDAYYGAQPHAFTTGTAGGIGPFQGSGMAGLNVDFGSGGEGDPTDDAGPYKEQQQDQNWVNGERLFVNPRPWENLEGDWAPLGNMVGRSDTSSGLSTVVFPAPYVELLRRAIVVGRLQPTARGWQFLQTMYGISPDNVSQQYQG